MSIELHNISKRVGAETYIYNTDLCLEKGGFNILLGTTLAGKTTLMRLMAGLELPTEGRVLFDGQDVTGVPVQKRAVAMVYQAFINYPNYTVFDNIASPLRVAGLTTRAIREKVQAMAELLQLTALLQRLPGELSGGQQQRTALARALVKQAPLVLLDEPLANLDYKLREELRDELPRLFKDSGATVVYATSEPPEALMLGGHTATIHEGRVTQYGVTPEIYRHPNTTLSAQIFSDPPMNLAKIKKRAGNFHLSQSIQWPTPKRYCTLSDGDYYVGLRPHHLTLGSQSTPGVTVMAKVHIAEINGSESMVHVDIDDLHWVSQSHGVHSLAIGDMIQLSINLDRCLYFSTEGQRLS